MEVDYIIVGLGIAGLAFAEELIAANKSFMVFEDNSQSSSIVAGGIYNPVILKRYTPVWKAKEQLEIAKPFYEKLEKKFHVEIDQKFKTKKAFKSIEDQNNWFEATDKPKLVEFLEPKIEEEKAEGIISDYGFGEVKQTGRINTKKLVEIYRVYLKLSHRIRFEKFEYQQIKISKNTNTYKDITAKKIVFCEGFGLKINPYFNYLPLKEAKGELLTIYAADLKIDYLLKSTLFVFPLGNNYYKVGATYNWNDKTSEPSEEGREELVEKLKKVITVPYTIIDQTAGVRPTVKDRRPLLGKHPEHQNLIVLNGLGTRGVMIAPYAAKQLYNHIENNENLDEEVDISRFN